MEKALKHILEAELKTVDGTPDKETIALAEARLRGNYARSSMRCAIVNHSVRRGLVAALNNLETMAQNGENLINTRPLAEYFRDFLVTKTAGSHNKNDWDLLAVHLEQLSKPLAQVNPKDAEAILAQTKQTRENPEQVKFLSIVDIILDHWYVLCSCDDTYAAMAVMAVISEPQAEDNNEDFMAFLQALEVSSEDWPK